MTNKLVQNGEGAAGTGGGGVDQNRNHILLIAKIYNKHLKL